MAESTPTEIIEANNTWVETKTVTLHPQKARPLNNDTVMFYDETNLLNNNNENFKMMKLNLSIFCHVMEQSALIDESGEQLDYITLACPKFKVVDIGGGEHDESSEEVERDSVLLSAALLSMPNRYRPNFDGHRMEIKELTDRIIEVNVYDKEAKSGYEHLGMTSEFLHSTITIAYIEEE